MVDKREIIKKEIRELEAQLRNLRIKKKDSERELHKLGNQKFELEKGMVSTRRSSHLTQGAFKKIKLQVVEKEKELKLIARKTLIESNKLKNERYRLEGVQLRIEEEKGDSIKEAERIRKRELKAKEEKIELAKQLTLCGIKATSLDNKIKEIERKGKDIDKLLLGLQEKSRLLNTKREEAAKTLVEVKKLEEKFREKIAEANKGKAQLKIDGKSLDFRNNGLDERKKKLDLREEAQDRRDQEIDAKDKALDGKYKALDQKAKDIELMDLRVKKIIKDKEIKQEIDAIKKTL